MQFNVEELNKRFERLENLIISTQKEVLTIDELIIFTSISKSTIYKLTASGEIPHYKQSKHLYFNRLEITEWLQANKGKYKKDIEKEALTALNF